MRTRLFEDNGFKLAVCTTSYCGMVAVFDDKHHDRTMHLSPKKARRMARALLKAADRAERDVKRYNRTHK